ncbi:MAG TPA: AAA family ATPase [Acidocella sp.]|uniref:trifunctional serine/threonine-protein kinase/ATP-binding protein/sensor histidine kinase n=1 Tax=Acidocella sp. TaxID=50710 RepID=UPI002B7A45CB|nr:AAA family ATPase [Acidocella sp.]HVE23138.1 AAA family ATPase [Acidocella sp.]
MTEFSRYLFSVLRDGDLTLHRGSGDGQSPILLLAADNVSSEALKRLQHEYALKAELDSSWAARPVALCHYNDRVTLVLEDPGGEPLDRLLDGPLAVAQFLHVAIPFTRALRRMHERGLIHKDIRPANVLVDLARGGAWLTGFGIASQLLREHRSPEPPEMIAGTLAYMAPEQTGRMNRSIDSRSDLYALGITFYEMLTGILPFEATDSMGWVHCHIARQPVPPDERVADIPGILSAMVMKLLAKTAEDRYQTAAAVEADLRRCRTEWEAQRRIAAFPLGMRYMSERLLIPERLYGREREIDTLLAAFERVAAQGATELVLLSGYSGVGKSSVVNELHKVLVSRSGLFAFGKFDQHKRDIPYATLAQAFQSLVRSILGQSEAELGRWRSSLQEALGANGALIVNLVPELELIIGAQPACASLSPHDMQKRFQTVLRRFVAAFARPEHPLVLFLDDLQWLDAATLDVFEHLVADPDMRHLLLIGAYRDNEVRPFDPLMRTLDALRNAKANVQDVVLSPLGLHDIERLLADSLHCAPEHAQPLALMVYAKTAGNPFFAIQFVAALAEEGLIVFDPGKAAWTWDLARIQAKGFTDNVVDLMVCKLNRLPDQTREVLKLFACLGNTAELAALAAIHGGTEEAIDSQLWPSVRAGLVFRQDRGYAFLHDRVREAAYSLIPPDQRAAIHLRIGRCLVAAMGNEKSGEHIFDVVNQFNHGAALLSDPGEIEQVAELNLRAGRKAKASTAYVSACRYFSAGTALLGPAGWATRYDLALRLSLERAECTFLSSQFDEAEGLIEELIHKAQSKIDKAAAYRLKIELYVVKSKNAEAVDCALGCLKLFGIDMPAHPSRQEVHAEYETIWRNLGDRSIESLIDLPRTTSPEAQAAMRVLATLVSPAFWTDSNLFDLHVCKMVNLSLRHGMTDASTTGYAWLGWVLCYAFERFDEGYRFGKLALDLAETRGFVVDRARVCYAMGLLVSWIEPLPSSIDLFRIAFRTGAEAGDHSFANFSAGQVVMRLILTGTALDEAWRESETFMEFAKQTGFRDGRDLIISQQRFLAALRGQTARLSTFSDARFDETVFEADLTADRMTTMVCWYWILKLGVLFLAGEYDAAQEAAERIRPLLWATPGEIQLLDYHFYTALTLAARAGTVPPAPRGTWHARLREHQQQLRAWAVNCPDTFESAANLVEAEMARCEGALLTAERLYEESIRMAHQQGFIQTEGIANECAARFYAARGFDTIARAYLRNARHCYLLWGAEGKVRQLEQLYPQLREKPILESPNTALFGGPVEHLEIATIVKASQALSSEIVPDRLVESLMRIAVEHAGAERGMLILFRRDEPRIEAEATTGRGGLKVTLRQAAVTCAELPESVFHTVSRTRRSVILDDAAVGVFAADAYIRQTSARSVLCLPLVKQAKLIGVLYLENNLASHVFTPARISVLELLASQAAISLENAALYADLQQENAERKRVEEELRRSEAFLVEGQKISHTGSWGWNIATGKLVWSEEHCRIFGIDPRETEPTFPWFMDRIHPEDRSLVQQTLDTAIHQRTGFSLEFRIVLPDGSVKHLNGVGRPVPMETDRIEDYIGTSMDITERKRGEEALRVAQADLTRVARLTMMGELTASIAHEINQPLGAIVASSNACSRWLAKTPLPIDNVRRAMERIAAEGHRAGDIVRSVRTLTRKSGPELVELDINDAIRDVFALIRSELHHHGVVLEAELSNVLEPVMGDRVQLQQVVLNLLINGIEAMSTATHGLRVLRVTSQRDGVDCVRIAVEDSGLGLAPEIRDRVFEAFFTTKSDGLGMGLSICRSIVSAHGGRLWAEARQPCGAIFQFTVPTIVQAGRLT